MKKFLYYGLFGLFFIFLAFINNAHSKINLIDAFFLVAKDGNLSNKPLDFPVVNNRNNPTWVAMKYYNEGHEAITVIPLRSNGFISNKYVFVTSKEGEEGDFQDIITKIIEYTWNQMGNMLLYSSKDNNSSVQINLYNVDNNSTKKVNWQNNDIIRSNFYFFGPNQEDIIYSSNKIGLLKLNINIGSGVYDDSIIAHGDIYDPIYCSDINKIIYYKYYNNNAGIYENTLRGNQENEIVNLPIFSEMSPVYSKECQKIIYVSNFHADSKYINTHMRDNLQNSFRLFSYNIKTGKRELEHNEYIKIECLRDMIIRNKNNLIYFKNKVFFLLRDNPIGLGSWNCITKKVEHYFLEREFNIKIPINGRKIDSKITIYHINSFDVCYIKDSQYIVLSASIAFEILNKKLHELYLVSRTGINAPGTIVLLYKIN